MKVGDLVYCPIDLTSGEMWPADGERTIGIIVKIETLKPERLPVEDNTIALISYPGWTGTPFFDSWQLRYLRAVE
jgi:hypothetical protein